ncbi:ABC transporter permease [Antarcticibacterium sp. 1MA-6-2]|uniref:ABC transporter permease n=1 Tax=Antarcticibacterium sp. 1MA-6-2 TaxID=2908210 RepID=UPI001F1C1C3D|nr:ABC transporter permease [Antarcticibacterium sp. 1MA-6-2]UJH90993.1 ABC transporter permease [Antarcticibacterium sp. 1MA-6-2]
MLSLSIKQILRNLWRNKSFTFINLLGLSLGIAAVVVLFLISTYESGFDQFHSETDNLYRVVSKTERNDQLNFDAHVPYPTKQILAG